FAIQNECEHREHQEQRLGVEHTEEKADWRHEQPKARLKPQWCRRRAMREVPEQQYRCQQGELGNDDTSQDASAPGPAQRARKHRQQWKVAEKACSYSLRRITVLCDLRVMTTVPRGQDGRDRSRRRCPISSWQSPADDGCENPNTGDETCPC